MIVNIATIIKEKRKEKGLTQKELAQGICAQAVISKIEKGEANPSIDIFFQLAKKLDIDMSVVSEIFELKNSKKKNKVFSDKVKNLLYMRDYDHLKNEIDNIEKKNMTIEETLYYEWLFVITEYMLKKIDFLETINKLKSLLLVTKNDYFKLYLKIVSAIGSIYSENNENKLALSYFELIVDDYKKSEDFQDRITFLYSISRAYYIDENLDDSLLYISKGIDEILDIKSIYMLGDSSLMKAHILYDMKLYEDSRKYCNYSITIFDIEKKDLLKNMAQKLLIEIEGEIK